MVSRISFTRVFISILLALSLVACSKEPFVSGVPLDAKAQGGANRTYLAYQHSIGIEAEEERVAAIFEAGQAACRDASADACVVLDSQISTGRVASASLKLRAKPAGIQKVIAALAAQGEIASRSTTAEDLEGPIVDASKKLEMLKDYRSKLEALLGRSNADVDALIKLNRELAQVQSEIEAMTGRQARLVQRVETEILNVSIGSLQKRSFWQPIAQAGSEFGRNLSQGFATTITAMAYLIPWGIALFVFGWLVRKLWRRRKRATPVA